MTNASKMMELVTKEEPLCEELKVYVYDRDKLGRVLHHPLVIELFLDEAHCALVNERFRLKKQELAKAFADKNWGKFIFLHERPYRIQALREIIHQADDRADLVAEVWIDSENIWQHKKAWIDIWSTLTNPHETMDENEKTVYRCMPDEITIHRGITHKTHNRKGMSWTRDKERAVWFAHRWKRGKDEPVVLTAEVKKKNVLAFFNGRNEEEVIVLPKHLRNVRE